MARSLQDLSLKSIHQIAQFLAFSDRLIVSSLSKYLRNCFLSLPATKCAFVLKPCTEIDQLIHFQDIKKWEKGQIPANTALVSEQFLSLFHVYREKSKEYCFSHYEELVYVWEVIGSSNQVDTVALMPGLRQVSASAGYGASFALCGRERLIVGEFSQAAVVAEGVYGVGVRSVGVAEDLHPLNLLFLEGGNRLLLLGKATAVLLTLPTLDLLRTIILPYEPLFLSTPEPLSPVFATFTPQGPICIYEYSNSTVSLSSQLRYRQAINYLHVSTLLVNTHLKVVAHIASDIGVRGLMCAGEAIGREVWGYVMRGKYIITWDREGKGNLFQVKEREICKLRTFEVKSFIQNSTFLVPFATHYCLFEPQVYSSVPGAFRYHHFESKGCIGKIPLMMASISAYKQLFSHLILIGTAYISNEMHPILYILSNHDFVESAEWNKGSIWLCSLIERRKIAIRLSEIERITLIDAAAVQLRRQRSHSESEPKKSIVKKKPIKQRKPDYDDFSLV